MTLLGHSHIIIINISDGVLNCGGDPWASLIPNFGDKG